MRLFRLGLGAELSKEEHAESVKKKELTKRIQRKLIGRKRKIEGTCIYDFLVLACILGVLKCVDYRYVSFQTLSRTAHPSVTPPLMKTAAGPMQ